jgi:hypothetical protein
LPAGDVFRGRLILALADGVTYQAIKRELHTTARTISRWKQRFEEWGIEGLKPKHKGSRPRSATPAVQAKVCRKVQQKPHDGSTHWSVRKLAAEMVAFAKNQTPRGHIPSLAHDAGDRGASDTTPLFLLGLALYRRSANEPEFLDKAARNALRWMLYQSPDDMVMVSQLLTSDWRDEQWVLGYGLYMNTLVYAYLLLHGEHEWSKAQTGQPRGQDWQTWSATIYLYAAACVQQQRTPFFDEIRA